MKKRIAEKIYRRVHFSIKASYQSFEYYCIKYDGKTRSATIRPSTAPYSRAQFTKASNVLKKARRTYSWFAWGKQVVTDH